MARSVAQPLLHPRLRRTDRVRSLGQPKWRGCNQMDDANQSLVRTLRAGGTDLAKLIEFCELRRPPVVYVAEPAVTAWEPRAPAAWQAAGQRLGGQHSTLPTGRPVRRAPTGAAPHPE